MSQSVTNRPAPPALQWAFQAVGEPEAEFGPSSLRTACLVLGGVLMTLGSLIYLGAVIFQWHHGSLELLGKIGGLCAPVVACLGVTNALLGRAYARRRWFGCAGGVVRQVGSRAEACAWDGLRSISQAKDQPVCRLDRKEGEPWELDSNQTPDVRELGRLLRVKAEAHHV